MCVLQLARNEYPGKLIVFEGVDGAGKTTLLTCAQEYLKERGIPCYSTRMPSSRIRDMQEFREFHDSHDEGRRNRVSPFALTVLVSGDRLIVQETEVIPALRGGQWVLCDRYVYSGLTICNDQLLVKVAERFIEPDLVVLACAPADVVEARVRARSSEKGRFYDHQLVDRQMRAFDEISRANGFLRIDTTAPYEGARRQIRQRLTDLLTSAS